MNDERYVAAIEISSSKIIASVGKMHSDGRLDIIATEQERGIESVRYGIIQNLEETSMRVTRVLERLQLKPSVAPKIISKVFVGLSGRSLRSIRTDVELVLPDDTEITEEIIVRLRQQALATAIDSSLEVVDAIPRVYFVGKSETRSPKGAVGNYIKAVFDLIVCRPELRRNLTRTLVDKIGIEVAGFVVTALSTAQVILTSEEKRLGCMLVDMGAETTTVSIYKDGGLRYFATLPMGGRNLTRDLTSLSLLEEQAEEIKITSGNAIARETPTTLNVNGISMAEVGNLISARSEEIVANIIEQLKYAGLKDKDLPAGIICIGGGTKLNGMLDLLGRQIDSPVRRGMLPTYIHIDEARPATAEMVEVASVLYSGAADTKEECLEMPGAEDLPVTGEGNEEEADDDEIQRVRPHRQKKSGGLWSKFQDRISEIFSNPAEDDSDIIE
ncbi:MAG: cell division protein FtsA [Muribaculaceae bacterium]|nr:cell division protein FtsA [Muribaculaceae bacterium]